MRSASTRAVSGFVCQSCAVLPRSTGPLGRPPIVPSRRNAKPLPTWRAAGGARWTSSDAAASQNGLHPRRDAAAAAAAAAPSPPTKVQRITDPAELAALAEDSCNKIQSIDGIPERPVTEAALQACLRAATALHPQLRRSAAATGEAQGRASTARLAALTGERRPGSKLPAVDARVAEASNRISHAAWRVLSHPNVEMAPELLEAYVRVQHQLGRPESLPAALDLYAKKSKPVAAAAAAGNASVVTYRRTNPNAASRAAETHVVDLALQTAIDAKNLDAALGVIEAGFCVPAFRRAKLIKHGTAPALGLMALPFGVVGLSTAYAAYWQNTMDVTTATAIGAAGISGYLLVVGSLGVIAKLSHKDQMRRVTWTPGTPLRYRWMREEERAALDKVALAWGFKEPWRHGEETGADWEGLREYMGYRQMLLDRVEFMDGMS
ncbi:hypothetical protein ISF_06271 [Cordyceps fumosorosea ARSEF 2679]|uniref:Uncharacterized protein n=1 Tax=Cordyceps fumosorosea (strain ARSEF 2679) TaxID=1081104 RepID=A0A167S7E2_CORFA|nr:hypothetical protein ISF_06271 [Cordyceps fumosorosea ARSEF 2679]OAA59336.1 hypothetical protein ISF_06271 [Cordyceps fumosorosea ARSEF 2679]